jgi:putative tryptophan/tyrosine transport system substrate-binding protein
MDQGCPVRKTLPPIQVGGAVTGLTAEACRPHHLGVNRRRFLIIAAGVLAAPLAAAVHAQPPSKVRHIGCLNYGSPVEFEDRIRALRTGLRDYGYVEGKNITLEFRWAETVDRLPALAADLVRLNVDVIFANSSTEVEAARRATTTIPIVFANHADPVIVGHVSSLARPGGNITGLSVLLTEIVAKQLEIMKQVLPHMKRIGALAVVTAPSYRPALNAVEAAAQGLGVQVLPVPVRTPEDLDGAFTLMARERVSGFLALQTPLIRSQRRVIAELSLKHRLAGMFGAKENVEAGGLMLYFADNVDLTRRAAAYIDKILKGARPADLPVEQASKYQLVINLKTATALGLTIPPSLLARADQVIE